MAGQGSARVILNEIDLSQVKAQRQLPQGVPAVVVGTSKKGPAFAPQVVANIQQFNEKFGNLSDKSKDSNANRFGPLALNEWLRNAQSGAFMRVLGVGDGSSDATGAGFELGTQMIQADGAIGANEHALIETNAVSVSKSYALGGFFRTKYPADSTLVDADLVTSVTHGAAVITGILMTPEGVLPSLSHDITSATLVGAAGTFASFTDSSSFTSHTVTTSAGTIQSFSASTLPGYTAGALSASGEFVLGLNGFANTEEKSAYRLSMHPEDPNFFGKVLNTDPSKIQERGHYLYSTYDLSKEAYEASAVGVTLSAGISVSADDSVAFVLPMDNTPLTSWRSRFTTPVTPFVTSQMFSPPDGAITDLTQNKVVDLFRLHALDDGEYANSKYRLKVERVLAGDERNWSTFDLVLERFESDPIIGDPLISWRNLTFDPDSSNFIGRVIGDMHTYYDFSVEDSKQTLVTEGFYEVRNDFVRVELSDEVMTGNIPKNTVPFGFRGVPSVDVNADDLSAMGVVASTTSYGDLANISVMPVPFVTSISRTIGTEAFPSSDLSWGVKFGRKVSSSDLKKETLDKETNPYLKNWFKFLPAASHPANLDLENNNYFTMQKIDVAATGDIAWEGAVYRRARPTASGRYLTPADATTKNMKYMKFIVPFFGGFDGLNIFNKEAYEMSNTACVWEKASGTTNTPTISTYEKALSVLSDKSTIEFQILAIPGIRVSTVTDAAMRACEDRFDAMFVMDVEEKDEDNTYIVSTSTSRPHVRNTISELTSRNLDTSFAAAYFPDVVMTKPGATSKITVPPSVSMLGAMSRNDSIADPWFAPAGIERGRVSGDMTAVNMNRDVLNDLYDADINPLYVPTGYQNEVYAFGQKTLLRDPSALDRVNVRRLLINIRRQVRNIADTFLFEPNRASTLARFSALVEPILLNVKQRQGVERYKVQIDTTTTTQNDIENNTIRGKIYLQPTKSVEFISLDFVVTNSID